MDRRAFFQFSASPRRASAPARAPRPAAETPRPLGIAAGLEPYAAPLDRARAAHLLRRIRYGAPPEQVEALTGLEAEAAVDALLDEALAAPLPEPPEWIDETPPGRDAGQDAREAYRMANRDWVRELRSDLFAGLYYGGLRDRLTVFWHNHFVTEIDAYNNLAVVAYRYVETLRTHALGNFKDFVHAAGLDPAMLVYLNGLQNRVGEPNENYARELLELFTMGPEDGTGTPNYTQQDVEEIARALTGWVVDPFNLTVQLVSVRHDGGEKTIFGRTEAFGYDAVIDLLFEERAEQIAAFLCRKLYRAFIYEAPDEALVAELAQVLLANDFAIAPVVRALLKSAHFFDEQVIGAQVKSPVGMLAGFLSELHLGELPPNVFSQLNRTAFILQQSLLDPPNVAGWEGHHAWLNTTTMPLRWLVTQSILFGDRAQDGLNLRPLATLLLQRDGVDPATPASVFDLAVAMAEHLLPTPLAVLDLNAPSEDFAGDLDGNPLPPAVTSAPQHERDLAKIFLAGVPWYEWNLDQPEAGFLLNNFIRYLTGLPEFQLT